MRCGFTCFRSQVTVRCLCCRLGRVIRTEKVELESDRVALIEAVMENKRKTKALEDDLLYRLTSTQVGPDVHRSQVTNVTSHGSQRSPAASVTGHRSQVVKVTGCAGLESGRNVVAHLREALNVYRELRHVVLRYGEV